MNPEYLLAVRHLKVLSATGAELVRDVSLTVRPGEIVGLVGESGCGKSITALAVAGLLPPGIRAGAGSICLDGQTVTDLDAAARARQYRHHIGMVFQDALTALNPLMQVGHQIAEVLKIHTGLNRAARYRRVLATMDAVGLPEPAALYRRYPHQLSGGQRQRVLIAMAIINRPRLLIADEPTTALDLDVQAQILALLKHINRSEGVSILFISHDLSTVRDLCDRVNVLYAGIPAEAGSTAAVISRPAHVYTRMLMEAVPTPEKRGLPLNPIPGRVPDHRAAATCCLFADRCPAVQAVCRERLPQMQRVGQDHEAACFAADGIDPEEETP